MESIFACCAAVRVIPLSSACMRRSPNPERPGPPPDDGLCAGAAAAAQARTTLHTNAIGSFMLRPPVRWKVLQLQSLRPGTRDCCARALAQACVGHEISWRTLQGAA